MSDKLEDLKRFIYDILLEWTDFDPDGQISFLIDSRFSETKQALQSYTTNKIIEQLESLKGWIERIHHQPVSNDRWSVASGEIIDKIDLEIKTLNHRKDEN